MKYYSDIRNYQLDQTNIAILLRSSLKSKNNTSNDHRTEIKIFDSIDSVFTEK